MLMDRENQGLKVVKVDKETLLSTLIENRDRHVNEYEETMAAFKQAYRDKLVAKIKQFDRDGKYESKISFDVPKSYEEEYTSVIEMLEMSVDDEIEITYEQFQRYARDKWEWKTAFDLTSSLYK